MALFNQRHLLHCCALVALLLLPLSLFAEVLVVTSAKSSLTTLSKNQVRDVFLGRLISLPDGRVTPIDQPESNPLRDEFYMKVTNKSAYQAKQHWAILHFTGLGIPPREGADSGDVKKILNSTPGAIGYIERSELDSSVKVILVAQ
jgi:ABC-type phosphate transport system substrate-binding protein